MTELTKTTGNALSADVKMGVTSSLTKDDLQQGRLMLLQSNSKIVASEDGRQGALINIVDYEEVAFKGNKEEQPTHLEFTICGILKYWVEKDADTDEFIGKRPATSMNELPWEETVNGRNIERTFHFSYMVLLPSEIKDGIEMPYELAFRSTAVKDTKKLNSMMGKLAKKGISSHAKVFEAKIVERSKDNNTWWGLDLGIARDATKEEAATTEQYFDDFVKYSEAIMASGDDFSKPESAPAATVELDTSDY